MIKLIFQGMVVGLANIIPGVSGGTMMVAMGLYDRLIHCITHIKSEFKEALKLLLPVFAGAGLAIVLLSRLFEFLLTNYPIPTNFAFCGLIAGSLPFIVNKVKGHSVTIDKMIPFFIFFAVVVGMALLGDASGADAAIHMNLISMLKLFGVGIVAAATMVVPGVSGSMMLMLLGYYDTILSTINNCVDALLSFDLNGIFQAAAVLAPFGIGVVIGIFLIAKMIEYIFKVAETHAYYGILGLIVASPIAILLQTDWSKFSIITLLISLGTFAGGWFVASKLGGE